ncbi:hypothetical protein B1M_33242 [Burkholderia sp. TJI49]|nr:hypothetical protein B1M_33242 [Burkholderia sp. TJI49]
MMAAISTAKAIANASQLSPLSAFIFATSFMDRFPLL